MANLVESSLWEPGIYQWETSDPVEGGASGIDNVPTRQLANRTSFLRQVLAVPYTAGDMLYATGANTLAKLPVGAANRVLTSSGTAPQWSTSLALAGGASFGGAVSAGGGGSFGAGLTVTSGLVSSTLYGLTINSTSGDAAGAGIQIQAGGFMVGRVRSFYTGSYWSLRLGTPENYDTAQVISSTLSPCVDGASALGHPQLRWGVVYAANGVIQTSLPESKEVLEAPGDDEVMAALRAVEIAPFHYHDDPGFDTGRTVRDRRTKKEKPVMQKHRHYGVMLPSLPEWARTTDEGINPLNVASLALRGWQLHDARLAAIEAALKLR